MDAIQAGHLAAEPRLMVSNRRDAAALQWARARHMPARHIPTLPDPAAADRALASALAEHGVELVVLSGYLRRLGPETLRAFSGRILNIHPGPLPRFGGEGMYGARVHQAVLDAGLAETAIVIHVVDGEYDHGPEIDRRSAPVLPGDTPQALEARVKALEPRFFVETLQRIAAGELELPRVA